MVCQCKCIERHMQSKRSVLEDYETRGRSIIPLSACNCNKVICSVLLVSNQICMNVR